jgi:hypothetical protein
MLRICNKDDEKSDKLWFYFFLFLLHEFASLGVLWLLGTFVLLRKQQQQRDPVIN